MFVNRKDKSKKTSHSEEVIRLYQSLRRTIILMMVTAFTLVFVAVAWFVSNNRVNSSGTDVSANNSDRYVLASSGVRSSVEEKYFLEDGKNILYDSNVEEYSNYYDTNTNEEITLPNDQKLKLYNGTTWHLQSSISMQPGTRGVLEFYVIPLVSGLKEIDFTLDAVGYIRSSDENNPVIETNDEIAKKLLKGHILFFQNYSDTDGYSGWLGLNDKTVTVKAQNGDLEANIPYKVSIYWVWPGRYRNYIYHQNSTHGDLFSYSSNDYMDLLSCVNMSSTKDCFFYNNNNDFDDFETRLGMSDEKYGIGNLYYNRADEYLGTQIDYIYLDVIPK